MRRKHGFTLIELLIVVAIIGILAAIAVYNLLNAQIRAKVARAQADMKAMENALAMYRLDHGRYIPVVYYQYRGDKWIVGQRELYRHLTTPVAYLTEIPYDPFEPDYVRGWGSKSGSAGSEHQQSTDGVFGITREIDYIPYAGNGDMVFFEPDRIATDWMLICLGPDGYYGWDYPAVRGPVMNVNPSVCGPRAGMSYIRYLYAPSNGIRSDGDLIHVSWASMQF
ncbi:MAG: prepilin-type N-terminal cleavage/methylation domain-containing protein [bacterium]